MNSAWFLAGGAIFAILGLLHAIYTLADTAQPSRLVPDDPAVLQQMRASGLRLARGGTTMWRAWVGFNFSHSIGAILFGVLSMILAPAWHALGLPKPLLVLPLMIALLYLWLALRYWFRIPAIGIALAASCLAIGWWQY